MRMYKWFHISVFAGAMVGVCILTLSDTLVDPATAYIFSLVRTFVGPVVGAVRLVLEALSPAGGADTLSRSSVPFRTDTIGHFVAWSAVGLLAAGIPVTAWNRFNLYFGLFALSAFLEAGQRYLSWSRVAEFSDLVANGFGLALGFILFGLAENVLIDRFGPLRNRTLRL